MSVRELERCKIALVGAECTGKTTIFNLLQSRLATWPRVAFVSEAARDYFMDEAVLDKYEYSTQRSVQMLALKREQITTTTGARIVICDRSVIDAIVYLRVGGDIDGANLLFEAVHSWLSTYNYFFLTDPRDAKYVMDPVRMGRPERRLDYHLGFVQFLTENHLPYMLLSGSPRHRLRQVLKYLEPYDPKYHE